MFKIKLRFNLSKVEKEIKEEAMLQVQNKVLEVIKLDLMAATPVDTGEAQNSWSIALTPTGGTITNSSDHIKYLNLGSSNQAPAYFIEQTVLKYGKPLGAIVEYKD